MGMSDYYRILRDKVGNECIFMPSAAGIVRNTRGEILLINKGNGENWSLPAGAIEPGEAPAEAVVREVWEETGLYVVPEKLAGVFGGKDFRYRYPNGHQVEYNVFMFDCSIQGGELSPVDDETAEIHYFHPDKMPELALPYPKELFLHTEAGETYFQWNEQWLKNLSQNNT